MISSFLILFLLTAQRLAELAVARRNDRRLFARGGVESGADHYPLVVGLHAAWLLGMWSLGWNHPPSFFWVVIYLLLQPLRVWTMASLGDHWTTRIITVPGEPMVRRGPYRYLRHPNYLIVAAEIAVAPLIFDLFAYALVFFLLNASLLWIRIRAEERALSEDAQSR